MTEQDPAGQDAAQDAVQDAGRDAGQDVGRDLVDQGPAIAVIGMAGRFPGAPDVARLWRNVLDGVESIRRLTDDELDAAGVDPVLRADPRYVRVAAPVDDVEEFDASFFGYSPREAELTDPQHRLFLECCWQALEDAGHHPAAVPGVVGVFAGCGFPSYLQHNLSTRPDLLATVDKMQLGVGNDRDSLSSMVSYKLDLTGPSAAVQTFCSTSLVCVHLACQSLLTHECDTALAGGVSVEVPQTGGYLYQEGGILSPDGQCRALGADARGSVIGSGVGVVVLKRLADALADGDRVDAVILGSAVTNDGLSRAGYTAPGVDGQAAVIADALANAGVDPGAVGYVECHGTGTLLGDSVELAAMARVFAGVPAGSCAIGSLKPNTGHLDRAAGVAGLIKAVHAVRTGLLPPSLHVRRPNPALDGRDGPFRVNGRARRWPDRRGPRRAGVSSFGLGGTNAHVVLQEPPAIRPGTAEPWPQALVLSAKNPAALDAAVADLRAHLDRSPDLPLADVAFTLQSSRGEFNHRFAVVCRDLRDAVRALGDGRGLVAEQRRRDRPVHLVLPDPTGWPRGTARDVVVHPEVRAAVDECSALLDGSGGVAGRGPAGIEERFGPAVADAVAQYAVARALLGWGVDVAEVSGEGAGGALAASLLGELPLLDALAAVVAGTSVPCRGTRRGEDAVTVVLGPVGEERPDVVAGFPDVTGLVARLWLAGARLDWAATHLAGRRRVSLPTYPFQRERYWIDAVPRDRKPGSAGGDLAGGGSAGGGLTGAAPAGPAGPARFDDLADWFSVPVWTRLPLPVDDLAGRVGDRGPWLVFADRDGPGAALVDALRDAGATVTAVRTGTDFHHDPDGDFFLRPGNRDDHDRLRSALTAPPRTVVHAWSTDVPAGMPTPEAFEAAQDLGFHDLLALLAAALRSGHTLPADVVVLTTGAVRVTGGDLRVPASAGLGGCCRVLGQENPGTVFRHLDVAGSGGTGSGVAGPAVVGSGVAGSGVTDPGVIGSDPRVLAHRVLAEICAGTATSVAFRGGDRWEQSFRPVRVPAGGAVPLRDRGAYLITGGLGDVGFTLAEHLARTRHARLALLGRTPLPPRADWAAWLDRHPADDRVSVALRRVRGLEAAGGEVLTLTADVADADSVRAAVARVRERFGALHGVVHGAGASDVAAFGLGHAVDRAQCDAHFRPKVGGFLALHRALAAEPLDFRLTLGSLSAVLGGIGFAAYAAANAALDGFALTANDDGAGPWLAVDWEGWRVGDEKHPLPGATVADFRMSPEEGVALFERALTLTGLAGQVVTSSGPLGARLRAWVDHEASDARPDASPRHARPALATPHAAPTTDEQVRLVEIWADLLGIDGIGVDDDFFELGGHSLLAVRVLARVRAELSTSLSLEDMLRTPTVRAVAAHLAAPAAAGGAAEGTAGGTGTCSSSAAPPAASSAALSAVPSTATPVASAAVPVAGA
ncbi:type I polyketide synthase [Saccharothrix xinjiangensis]|uniref:SDR family NAD(P)-dependent oxidoreductase n=1 Tax=Saccharothrix xinjiangensis TaxID=204798 RepID=A0ABV9Y3B1_9PSEU